ncbi:VOC family protein [Novosphingobium gossypii]|uniref:VOC family protein n=1 Tax=Novosphingobium gossypii TaxID=1604774 RepID=UPI003D237E59
MTLLRCATHTVRNVVEAAERYARWLDYTVVEEGAVSDDLAASWQAPASAGKPYVLMRPASGSDVLLRFVEGDPVPDYAPIRTYGWAAIEICVSDVEAVNRRMIEAPDFEVIGPPKPLDGFPTVKPMQVRGPDLETVYLTEIRVNGAEHGLPTPRSLVDRPFILVLACSDLEKSIAWVRDVLGFDMIDPVSIHYSMISLAFDLPAGEKVALVTAKYEGETFLELDQYPQAATPRPQVPGALPPGVSICTINVPDFSRLEGHWAVPPQVREGPLYNGAKVGLLRMPDGALLEVIEGGRVL